MKLAPDPLPRLGESRPLRAAVGLVALILGAMGFLPLFGGPGYEAALAAGLVLPSAAAVAVALEVQARRPAPLLAFGRGVRVGLALSAAALVLVLAHGFRVGFCAPQDDLLLFLVGPAAGAVLGGVWGAVAGVATLGARRRAWLKAVALALAGPLTGVLISLWRFYSSPMVFAYDPFFGYFAGPLYDTVLDPVAGLVTYRLGSALALGATAVLALHTTVGERGPRASGALRPGLAALGVLCAAGAIGVAAAGPELGHWHTVSSIRAELEREVQTERCRVVYDASIWREDAEAFARECTAHVLQIEAHLEVRGPERIVAYLFANEEQKGRLMGAASTYIAKPWRSEVYLQFRRFPHPVLGHELAHVIAGSFGQGPFRVSGPLFGLLPDPGRIEGIATAASPSEDDDLTLGQWSAAMKELELLPPLSRVFRLSFLGENSSKAYTVAGAFVAWFRDAYGAAALRRWYGGEALEALTSGKDLADLEREWHAHLTTLELDERVMAAARARFDRPGVFSRKCPHVIDRWLTAAGSKLGQRDVEGARAQFERVLALEPRNLGARHGLSVCALREAKLDEARRRYRELEDDPSLHALERLGASEALGDLALVTGDPAEAKRRFVQVARQVQSADHLRSLAVKSVAPHDTARRSVAALLVGDPVYGRDFAEAAAWLGRWSVLDPEDGTADYLLGRNFYGMGRYAEARERLDQALGRSLPIRLVETEALRNRATLACLLGERERGSELAARYLARGDVAPARRQGFGRFAERCGFAAP